MMLLPVLVMKRLCSSSTLRQIHGFWSSAVSKAMIKLVSKNIRVIGMGRKYICHAAQMRQVLRKRQDFFQIQGLDHP